MIIQKNLKKKKCPKNHKEKRKKNFFSSKIYSLIHIEGKNSYNTKPPKSDFLLDNYHYETAFLLMAMLL